jgi:GDP-L-fucose synthase
MDKEASIYIAGRATMTGAAIARRLAAEGYAGVYEGDEPDLTDRRRVEVLFDAVRPGYVFFVAGKSGGIGANQTYPADLMYDNLLSVVHVVQASAACGVRKLLYLASSCSYPKLCDQPMRVESLMTGPLETTNEGYATAKLAGLALCRAYRRQYGLHAICAIPANVFGPGDDFSLENAHVIGALIRRMHEAKSAGIPFIELWGTGAPRREFLYVDDLADACVFLMNTYDEPETVNIGSGVECSIAELAGLVQEVTGYAGAVRFDATRPDGMPRKLLDSSHLHTLGWRTRTPFRAAVEATYAWYLAHGAGQGA